MAIFLDIPALVDLSVPERDQPLETRPCVPQFGRLDGHVAERLHHLVAHGSHLFHASQITDAAPALPREMRSETKSEATVEVSNAEQ